MVISIILNGNWTAFWPNDLCGFPGLAVRPEKHDNVGSGPALSQVFMLEKVNERPTFPFGFCFGTKRVFSEVFTEGPFHF